MFRNVSLSLSRDRETEIHQQIIDHQAAQTGGNSADSVADGTIQRSRSSITRTLLMNSGKSHSSTFVLLSRRSSSTDSKGTAVTTTSSVPPSFSQDFEYLIRRELDIEHAPSTLQRNSEYLCDTSHEKRHSCCNHAPFNIGSTPSVFQNLSSARSIPPVNPQSPSQSRMKRKRYAECHDEKKSCHFVSPFCE